MRLVPIVGRTAVDGERHRECDIRERRLFHNSFNQRNGAGEGLRARDRI